MKHVRYSRWDETRKWHDPKSGAMAERVFQELSNYMSWGLTTQEALEWLTRQGLSDPGGAQMMGTEELLQRLRQMRQEILSSHNMNRSLEDIRQEINRIVELELHTAKRELGWSHSGLHAREETLYSLSPREGEALTQLAAYKDRPGFLNDEARDRVEKLLARRPQISELETFIRRHGPQFQGPDSLDFNEAREVMNHFQQISSLSEALRGGELSSISLTGLDLWLSPEEFQSLSMLIGVSGNLESHGFTHREDGVTRLTPKGIRLIGQDALDEIFKHLAQDQMGLHPLNRRGQVRSVQDDTRPYEFGMPFDIDMAQTIKNALHRGVRGRRVGLKPEDFAAYDLEADTRATTILMLDMSWSMSRDGRFPAAKRVAIAMDSLIRQLYPKDHYYTIGFSTRAKLLDPGLLPDVTWDPADPFTNLQEGLALARRLFRRHRTVNRQIIVITDGQPTATYINNQTNAQWPGFMGAIPPDIHRETLREVAACTKEKITINTFMLDDNPVLTRFIGELTRINHGRAFYSLPSTLGRYLLVDYLSKRKKMIA
ncbi:MAG: hypothetical protein OEW12_08250 [Deltaproteobacteria bacterium]|nr:hypothetical protein [Deltaproteobacteria bacterium]